MKKALTLITIALLFSPIAFGQKIITKTAHVKFFSHTPVEDIEAHNHQTLSVLNTENGQIAFSLLMKSFEFEKALMQEHFNENYMESEKFPSAVFKGNIVSDEAIDLSQDGTYEVAVKGSLNIHGVQQPTETTATITVAGNTVTANTKFIAKPADFDIEIPSVVVKNIAEEIEVTTTLNFNTAKK